MGRDGARPSRGKQMVRNDHWSFDPDLAGVRSHRRSIAAAQADRTSLVRRLARIGIDRGKSELVCNRVMHRNKYLTFLHRIGYEGGSRYLPTTRCNEDFF